MRTVRALPNDRFVFTGESLVVEDSVPDPDCWVRPREAMGVGSVGPRLTRWRPQDVLLVVEVADETVSHDLGPKARVYARAGFSVFSVYWVITRDGIYEHTEPTADGYRVRVRFRGGDTIPVRCAGTVARSPTCRCRPAAVARQSLEH
ncbi:MAG: Uma2 family endonuclease [Egibacteraceae bacterium]